MVSACTRAITWVPCWPGCSSSTRPLESTTFSTRCGAWWMPRLAQVPKAEASWRVVTSPEPRDRASTGLSTGASSSGRGSCSGSAGPPSSAARPCALAKLGHPLGLHQLHELHVDGVDGQPGGVPQGHLAVVGVAVVLEVLAVDDQLRRAGVHRVDRVAVVQRLGEHERLHGRAGLADGVGGVVELAALEVPAAVHGPHRPVARVDGDQRRLRVVSSGRPGSA